MGKESSLEGASLSTEATLAIFVDPPSPVVALGVFALVIFHLIAGWKLFKLG